MEGSPNRGVIYLHFVYNEGTPALILNGVGVTRIRSLCPVA